jgi:hypothetical protein
MRLHFALRFRADIPVFQNGGFCLRFRLGRLTGRAGGFCPLLPFPPAALIAFALPALRFVLNLRFGNRRIHLIFRCGKNLVAFFVVFDEIGDVEERILLKPDVHKCGLHSRKDLGYLPFVDVGQYAAISVSFYIQLCQLVVLEDGDLRFQGSAGNDHFFNHLNLQFCWTRTRKDRTGTERVEKRRIPCRDHLRLIHTVNLQQLKNPRNSGTASSTADDSPPESIGRH